MNRPVLSIERSTFCNVPDDDLFGDLMSAGKDDGLSKYSRSLAFAKKKGGNSPVSRKTWDPLAFFEETTPTSACTDEDSKSQPSSFSRSRWADLDDEDDAWIPGWSSNGTGEESPNSDTTSTVATHRLAKEPSFTKSVTSKEDALWSFSTAAGDDNDLNDLTSESGDRDADEHVPIPSYKQIELEDEFHFQQVQLTQQRFQHEMLKEQQRQLEVQRHQLAKQEEQLKRQQLELEEQQRKLSQVTPASISMMQTMPVVFSALPGGIPMGMMPLTTMSPLQNASQATQGPPGTWNNTPMVNPMQMPRFSPMFGYLHRFHPKAALSGLSHDLRTFTKRQSKGRLSIASESEVRYSGIHRYAVQFTSGELSNADGVGFIFSNELPCPKNIQKIVSVFANRTGRICIRAHSDVERCDVSVKELELGDWLEVVCNLDNRTIMFTVFPADGSPTSSATVNFGRTFDMIRMNSPSIPRNPCGYLAAVIKHTGVTVTLGS
jgi:hypothetical protein